MNQLPAHVDWSIQEADAAIKAVKTDVVVGLTTQDSAARLLANGRNELQPEPPVPAWRRIVAQFQSPLIYLLLAAIAIALLAWGADSIGQCNKLAESISRCFIVWELTRFDGHLIVKSRRSPDELQPQH